MIQPVKYYLRLWRLCIILTCVSVQFVPTLTAPSSMAENHQYNSKEANDKKYDFIDVTTATKDNSKMRVGQTTRIVTTGEVDDNFWLKHLGEDFKRAIHLQVEDDGRFSRILNGTATSGKINYDDHIKKENKSQESTSEIVEQTYSTEQASLNEDKNSTTPTIGSMEHLQSVNATSASEKKTVSSEVTDKETFTKYLTNEMRENFPNKIHLNSNMKHFSHFKKQYNDKMEFQNSLQHTEDQKEGVFENEESNVDDKRPLASIAPKISLLQKDDMYSMQKHKAAMIVKMPPIIYHHRNSQFSNEGSKLHQTRPAQQFLYPPMEKYSHSPYSELDQTHGRMYPFYLQTPYLPEYINRQTVYNIPHYGNGLQNDRMGMFRFSNQRINESPINPNQYKRFVMDEPFAFNYETPSTSILRNPGENSYTHATH